MGACGSKSGAVGDANKVGGAAADGDAAKKKGDGGKDYEFYTIQDKYSSLEEVSEGLREAGLEASQLVSFEGGCP